MAAGQLRAPPVPARQLLLLLLVPLQRWAQQ
jgi:hypothetical protein